MWSGVSLVPADANKGRSYSTFLSREMTTTHTQPSAWRVLTVKTGLRLSFRGQLSFFDMSKHEGEATVEGGPVTTGTDSRKEAGVSESNTHAS